MIKTLGVWKLLKWKATWRTKYNFNRITTQFQNRSTVKWNAALKISLPNNQSSIHTLKFSFPVVDVRKKDGTNHLCFDYKKWNQKTIPDRHPLPRVQNVTDNLGSNKLFSDQRKACHQLQLDPESCQYTAFITSWGFHELVQVPFGLMHAHACFQRFMKQCFDGHRDDFVIRCLDYFLIYSCSYNEHLQHLKLVFQRLKKFGIKIIASKRKLFRREKSYLGRPISSERYTPWLYKYFSCDIKNQQKTKYLFRTVKLVWTCWLLQEISPKLL